MAKPKVMAGFKRRRDFAKARGVLVRLCVDAPPGRKVSLVEAARRVRMSPARAYRILEPLLYARYVEKVRRERAEPLLIFWLGKGERVPVAEA